MAPWVGARGQYTLCEPGHYTFRVTDAYGDGLCCSHGQARAPPMYTNESVRTGR